MLKYVTFANDENYKYQSNLFETLLYNNLFSVRLKKTINSELIKTTKQIIVLV